MLGKSTSKLLQDTEAKMQARVPPQFQGAFQKLLMAGLTIMYSPKSRQMVLKQMKQPGDPAAVVGEAVAKLMGLLIAKSMHTAPTKAAVPAGTVLLCEAMDFAEKAGMLKVNEQTLETAMHSFSAAFLQLVGVSPQKMSLLLQKQQAMKQPEQPPAQGAPQAPPQAAPAAPGGLVAQAQGAPA